MITEFEQKRGINSRKFILTSDKILVETRTLHKINKYEVKLDQLGLDTHYLSDNTIAGKIFLGVCITIIIVVTAGYFLSGKMNTETLIINYILWSLLGCVAYFSKHQDDVYLVGGQTNLVFYREIPNEKAVLDFIEKVKSQAKFYLKEKYTLFDNTTSDQDFYSRINWLRDREIISYAEYTEIKSNFETNKLL